MAEKRKANQLDEATSSVQGKPNQPKRVKWDVDWVDGEYKSRSTNRKYDPVTNRAIVKPRGPQGNKPQNVKGVMPGSDFYEHFKDKHKYILMNIEQDVASLQEVAWEDPAALRYISNLQTRGRVPSVHCSILWWSAPQDADLDSRWVSRWPSLLSWHGIRELTTFADAVKYDHGGHFLECHFVENRGSKICLTFRSFMLSHFIKYFVNRFEAETAFNALMDEDAEGEDEDFFNDEKDEGPESSASVESKQRPDEINSALTHFALDILKPGKSEDADLSSEELSSTKLKYALIELPWGTAFRNFPTETLAKAKEFTGWPDFDDALGVSSIRDSSRSDNTTQSMAGTRYWEGVSVACKQEATLPIGATSTTIDGDSPDAAIVLPESNEVSRSLEHEGFSPNEKAEATFSEKSHETPTVVLESEVSTQIDNASSFTVGSTAEAPIVIPDDEEAFVPLPSQASTVPLAPDAVNNRDVDERSVELDYTQLLLEPLSSEAEDWLEIWEQEQARSQSVTVG